MAGLSIRSSVSASSGLAGPVQRPIVAWGDSLTHGYPALAAGLFGPARKIEARPVGGQTSTQVAARQGGVPIRLTLEGNTIPAMGAYAPDMEWNFETAQVPPEWETFAPSHPPLQVDNGTLRVAMINPAGAFNLPGAQVHLGPLTIGDVVRVEIDIAELTDVPLLQVGLMAGSWLDPAGPQLQLTGPGRYHFEHLVVSNNDGYDIQLGLLLPTNAALDGVLRIASVKVFKSVLPPVPIPVTQRSISPITHQGPWIEDTRRIDGTLAGISGTLERADSADDSGNDTASMTFTRSTSGPAAPCPAGSLFTPHEATSLRNHTAWIWIGRNNFSAPETVKADIAAMFSHLGHQRYLIGSVLNGAGEPSGSPAHSTILALNADLATIYGTRFLNLRSALLAAANSSAGDVEDQSKGVVPRSLRSDAVHLNAAGQAVVATAFHAATLAQGW